MSHPRKHRANIALALLAPWVFLGLAEILLHFAGVKPLYLTEDPFVGFASGQPLFIEEKSGNGPPTMVTNPAKITHFNGQTFPRSKPPGAYRIFTLGGSTTYGHPWRDPVSFSGWLRELLPAADPGRTWEVINAGGISYASYREANLVGELTAYQPDLFIIYSGHNEFLEERTYRKAARMPAILRETSAWLDRTRTYTAMRLLLRKLRGGGAGPREKDDSTRPFRMAGEVDDVLAKTIGPISYTRDGELRRNVLDHYRLSLQRMARLAHAAGAEVLFLTTPGNEKDCSPFKSEPKPGLTPQEMQRVGRWLQQARAQSKAQRPDLALECYDSALALDDRHADLVYEAARAAFAAGRYPEAKRLFQKALDEDICPLRALPAMRGIVREVAESEHAQWLDVTGILESKTRRERGHDILGEPDFVDHVHLSIEDYGLLARSILDNLLRRGVAHAGPGWGAAVDSQVTARVMAKVDDKTQGEGLHNLAKVTNWAGKHEDAARIAEKGLALDSTSLEAIWSSLFVGADRERQGRESEAVPHYRRAVSLDTNSAMSRRFLGAALMRAGQDREAAAELTRSLELDPEDPETRESLGRLELRRGNPRAAVPHLRMALSGMPGKAELHCLLADALLLDGKADEAAGHFGRALQIDPRSARAVLGLGRIAEARGDKGQAINQYARALSLDPALKEAQQALSRSLLTVPGSKP